MSAGSAARSFRVVGIAYVAGGTAFTIDVDGERFVAEVGRPCSCGRRIVERISPSGHALLDDVWTWLENYLAAEQQP